MTRLLTLCATVLILTSWSAGGQPLQHFIRTQFREETFVVISSSTNLRKLNNTILDLIQPKLLVNVDISHKSLLQQTCNIIIIEDSLESLNAILENLGYNLNTRAKFLLIFQHQSNEDDLKLTLETLWRCCYIYNVVIYVNATFVTWYPYSSECGNVVHLVTKPKSLNWFDKKIPNDIKGCPVSVTWVEVADIIKSPWDKSNPGYVIRVIDEFGERINSNVIYLDHNIHYILLSIKTGDYRDLIAFMTSRRIDISMTFQHSDDSTGEGAENSIPIFQSDEFLVLPPRKPIKNSAKILGIFSFVTWLVIGVTMLVMIPTWRLVTGTRYVDSFFYLMQLAFQCVPKPEKFVTRLVFSSFLFCTANLSWIYTSQLSGVLTHPSYEPKITSIADLLRTDMKLKFYYVSKKFFEGFGPDIYEKIMARRSPESDELHYMTILMEFIEKMEYGVILAESNFPYIKNAHHLQVLHEDKIQTSFICLTVRRGFPLLHKLNEWILRMRESGLIMKWMYEAATGTTRLQFPIDENLNAVALKTEHVLSAFVILLAGFSLGLVVLIGEIGWQYCIM